MVRDREESRCRRELSIVLEGLSHSLEKVPKEQHAFLEIKHNGNEIIFPQENTLSDRVSGLLVSRFRADDIRPSLFFPYFSPHNFLNLVRESHLRTAEEVFQVFTKAILPTNILDPDKMGTYARIVSRHKGLFNYMISLLRQRSGLGKVECPHTRIVERDIMILGDCPDLYLLCNGSDNWYGFLNGVDHVRFQTDGSLVSDRGGSPGVNLKNVTGVSYAFTPVPDSATSQIIGLVERLREGSVEDDCKDEEHKVA